MAVLSHAAVIGKPADDDELPSLVQGVQLGRPAAAERLMLRVQARVRMWAARFTDDEDNADDIAQEVLIGLERRVKRFDGRSKFSTWLFTVTRNVALSKRQRDVHRAELLSGQAAESSSEMTLVDPDAAKIAAIAMAYFDALPAKQRLIFELADLRGLSPAEIARELKMEQSTVRAHLFKARRTIRGKLLEHHSQLVKEYRS